MHEKKTTASALVHGMALCLFFAACADGRVEIPPQAFAAGGWSLDAQFMDVMGSPYLLAHGLGVPVRTAAMSRPIDTAKPNAGASIATQKRFATRQKKKSL